MRNLKRVLSLALALVMVLGMMVIGTSAATYTDVEEITYTEAVDVMSGLGVFEGIEAADGTFYFDPNGGLTREQAATLMARIHSKGAVEKLNATKQIFDDVAADKWSAKYIEYCYDRGLVDGLGDGTFNPGGELTGIAFAKLLLVAMGYDADAEGYVGKDWATSIAVDALDNGLYVDGVDITKALNREQAAQMLFQALEQETVAYDVSFDKATNAPILGGSYADGNTFMGTYFPTLAKVEGVITNTTASKGQTVVTYEATKAITDRRGNVIGTKTENVDVTLSGTAGDWTNVGYAARAWYLDGKKADTALSLVITGEDLYVYTDGADIDDLTTEKLANKKPNPYYVADIVKTPDVFSNGEVGTNAPAVGTKVALVDNDGDGVADAVVYTEYTAAKVTNVTKISKSGVVSDYSYTLDNGETVYPRELADIDALTKGTYIAYVVVDGEYYVTELEVAEGEFEYIDSIELTTSAAKCYSIDGVEYIKSQASGVNFNGLLVKANINNDVVYVVDMYDYLVRVEAPKPDPDSYLYVFDNEHDSVLTGLAETLVAFVDGSVDIVNVMEDVKDSELATQIFTYEVKNGAYYLDTAKYEPLYVAAYNTYEVSMTGIADLSETVIVDLRAVYAGKADEGTVYTGYTEIPSFVEGTILYIEDIDLGFMVAGKAPAAAGTAITYVVFDTSANIVDKINVGTVAKPVYVNTYELKAGVLIKGELVEDYVLSAIEKSNIDKFGVGVYAYDKEGNLTYTSFAENTDVQWKPESNGTVVYKGVDVTAAETYDIIVLDISEGEIGEWEQLVEAGNYYSWIDATNKIMYIVGDATVESGEILAAATGTAYVNGANMYWENDYEVTAYQAVPAVDEDTFEEAVEFATAVLAEASKANTIDAKEALVKGDLAKAFALIAEFRTTGDEDKDAVIADLYVALGTYSMKFKTEVADHYEALYTAQVNAKATLNTKVADTLAYCNGQCGTTVADTEATIKAYVDAVKASIDAAKSAAEVNAIIAAYSDSTTEAYKALDKVVMDACLAAKKVADDAKALSDAKAVALKDYTSTSYKVALNSALNELKAAAEEKIAAATTVAEVTAETAAYEAAVDALFVATTKANIAGYETVKWTSTSDVLDWVTAVNNIETLATVSGKVLETGSDGWNVELTITEGTAQDTLVVFVANV